MTVDGDSYLFLDFTLLSEPGLQVLPTETSQCFAQALERLNCGRVFQLVLVSGAQVSQSEKPDSKLFVEADNPLES